LRFYAIDGSEDSKKKITRLVPLTNKFDASNSLDRIIILRIIINIARILRTLKGIIPGEIVPIGKRQKFGLNFYRKCMNLQRL
jgi:hypothetical protein